MDGPAVLEVTAQRNVEARKAALLLPERIQIEEGLRGVLVTAVAGVHDGDAAVSGHQPRRAFPGVPDHEEVCELAYNAGRIRQALPLGDGGSLHIGGSDDPSSQAQHGGLERKAGTGAGLEKEAGQDGTGQAAALPLEIGIHFRRRVEHHFNFRIGKIVNGDEASPAEAHGVRHPVCCP